MKGHALGLLLGLPGCAIAPLANIGQSDGIGVVKVCRSAAEAPDVYARIGWTEVDPIFGEIVHVSLRTVDGEDPRQLGHAAFTPDAMTACDADATGAFGDADPDFAARYRAWREGFESGTAGVFDISPADALAAMVGPGPSSAGFRAPTS